MARTERQTQVTDHTVTDADTQGLPTMADAWNELAVIEKETNDNAQAVARQVGYDGTLTVGALEDEIRFYQRRSVEACIELGKRLLVLKELTPHGEFQQRIELLGIGYQTGKKFMAATMKFSKGYSNTLLAAGTQTKMLELLVLDDGEIDALESGETVRGVTLDKIETMSVSELKKALRDANERIEAKDAVIKDKSAKIDEQAESIAAFDKRNRTEEIQPVSVEQALINARTNLQNYSANIKAQVMSQLRACVKTLHQIPGDHSAFAGGCLIEIGRELAILRDEYGLPATVSEDLTPEWMKPGWEDELKNQYTGLPTVSDILSDEA